MRIAAIQHDVTWLDAESNHRRVAGLLATAADAGVRFAVCPEMFATGFSMDTAAASQPMDGPTVSFMLGQAALHDMWVGGSVSVAPEEGLPVNRFVIAGPSGQLQHYDKRHPFSYADEQLHYQSGNELVTVDVDGCRVTPLVCYDLRFAPEFWERAPSTDLYVVVANWPSTRQAHWSSLLVARAIENQAYVLGVNRVGEAGSLRYVGGSSLTSPQGESSWATTADEGVLVGEVDPAEVVRTREQFPFMADRRPLE